jgi:hypothetical protein
VAVIVTQAQTGRAALILNDVVVRVYDNTGLPETVRRAGLTHAAGIFARADVEIDWVRCPARCGRPPGERQLILRLTRSPRTAVGLASSMIDPTLRAGRLATVFVDQVDALARRAGVDQATILSRAIAHEIGHLLLGSTEHTQTGLMRGVWTTESLRRAEEWHFTPFQGTMLRARIAASIPPIWNVAVPQPTTGLPGT